MSCKSNKKNLNRRDFMKATSAAAAGAIVPLGRLPIMAGPFTEADYTTLIPADKKLDAAWVKSLYERGKPEVYHKGELKYIGMPVGGYARGRFIWGETGSFGFGIYLIISKKG